MVDPILLGGRRICLPAGRETGCAPERVTPVRLRQRSHGEFLWNHENRTCSPGPLSHTRCRPARPVRRHRRIRQSPAAPFCPRAYHPRAGRAPSRLMVSTKSREGHHPSSKSTKAARRVTRQGEDRAPRRSTWSAIFLAQKAALNHARGRIRPLGCTRASRPTRRRPAMHPCGKPAPAPRRNSARAAAPSPEPMEVRRLWATDTATSPACGRSCR